MHLPRQHFRFVPTIGWFRHGLLPVWKPFLLGCAVCALVTGLLGWLLVEALWRWRVHVRYRRRRAALLATPPGP
jgi:uncharacterized protein (DUF2062 family)